MQIEIEAKSIKINKDQIREILRKIDATQIFSERKFTRAIFQTPEMTEKKLWVRVRDEGDGKITMSLKQVNDEKSIVGTTEILLNVDNFENAKNFIVNLGIPVARYQENFREEWELDGVTLDIDTWPRIDPWLEVEAHTEEEVKRTFEKLGLDYSQAFFGSADIVYRDIYKIDILNISELRF